MPGTAQRWHGCGVAGHPAHGGVRALWRAAAAARAELPADRAEDRRTHRCSMHRAMRNMQQTSDAVRHAIGVIRRTAESMLQTPCDIATCVAEPLSIRATCDLAADVRRAADDVPDARRWMRNLQQMRPTHPIRARPRGRFRRPVPIWSVEAPSSTVRPNSERRALPILVQLCSTEPKRLHLGAKALTAMMQPLYWSYP